MPANTRDFSSTASGNDPAFLPAQGDPLVAFYTGLARLAADAGDVEQATVASRRALRHLRIADAVSHWRSRTVGSA